MARRRRFYYAPECFVSFTASRARDSRATLVGVAVWFKLIQKRAPVQREGWSYAPCSLRVRKSIQARDPQRRGRRRVIVPATSRAPRYSNRSWTQRSSLSSSMAPDARRRMISDSSALLVLRVRRLRSKVIRSAMAPILFISIVERVIHYQTIAQTDGLLNHGGIKLILPVPLKRGVQG